ncbi:MAG: HNH endonuclease [Bacillota bacterium]
MAWNKFTLEEVKEKFKERGCTLLSEEYKGKDIPVEFICKCGNRGTITWNNLRNGSLCLECGKKKAASSRDYKLLTRKNNDRTFKRITELFKSYGCELLEEEYLGQKVAHKFKCSCGNISTKKIPAFRVTPICEICVTKKRRERISKTLLPFEEVASVFLNANCTLLSREYKGWNDTLRFICSCGNEGAKTFAAFRQNPECRKCSFSFMRGENNWRWDSNLSDQERESNKSRASFPEQKQWKLAVYKRDGFSCRSCGSSESNTLRAHHLDSYNWCTEKRTDVNNGVTLCEDCHVDFHGKYGYGDNTRGQYEEWIRNKREQGA